MKNKVFSCIPSNKDMQFWINNDYNVLFVGHAGVGKTTIILDAWKSANLNYKYFSASTMDPWVDFIGIPKEKEDEKGSYLELVKPKDFRDDEIQAIFFDEFNRSAKKVRNAVMELIQFKSINGKKYPNLKIIWAAINPDADDNQESDMDYDVEPLDPAQKDRFHIQIEIPYKPSMSYFVKKFGDSRAKAAIDWWNELPKETQNVISPRRLDTALDVVTRGGNIKHVLPPVSGLDKLQQYIRDGSPKDKFNDLLEAKDLNGMKTFLSDENCFSSVEDLVAKNAEFCLPLLEEEKLVKLIYSSEKICDSIFDNYKNFESTIKVLAAKKNNDAVCWRAKECVSEKFDGNIDISPKTESKTDGTKKNPKKKILKGKVSSVKPTMKILAKKTTASLTTLDFTEAKSAPKYAYTLENVKKTLETATTSYYKANLMKNAIALQENSISYDTAIECLDLVDDFYNESRSKTIDSIKCLPEFVNYCYNVVKEDYATMDKFVEDFPNIANYEYENRTGRFAFMF